MADRASPGAGSRRGLRSHGAAVPGGERAQKSRIDTQPRKSVDAAGDSLPAACRDTTPTCRSNGDVTQIQQHVSRVAGSAAPGPR